MRLNAVLLRYHFDDNMLGRGAFRKAELPQFLGCCRRRIRPYVLRQLPDAMRLAIYLDEIVPQRAVAIEQITLLTRNLEWRAGPARKNHLAFCRHECAPGDSNRVFGFHRVCPGASLGDLPLGVNAKTRP